jgi:hypothetical protein
VAVARTTPGSAAPALAVLEHPAKVTTAARVDQQQSVQRRMWPVVAVVVHLRQEPSRRHQQAARVATVQPQALAVVPLPTLVAAAVARGQRSARLVRAEAVLAAVVTRHPQQAPPTVAVVVAVEVIQVPTVLLAVPASSSCPFLRPIPRPSLVA